MLKISRSTGPNTSEGLSRPTIEGTKFIGAIQKENLDVEKKFAPMGIVALIERRQNHWNKFMKASDENLENIAESILWGGKKPFIMKWMRRWFPEPRKKINYEQINGREWGRLVEVLGINMFGSRTKVYLTANWTVNDGTAIFFVSQAFSPYKREVDRQVRKFLGSLSEVEMVKE